MRGRSAAAMPTPVSLTLTTSLSASRAAESVTEPPSGGDLIAVCTRLPTARPRRRDAGAPHRRDAGGGEDERPLARLDARQLQQLLDKLDEAVDLVVGA